MPQRRARFESFFRCPVGFGAPVPLLAFDRAIAEQPIPGGNDVLASASDALLATYLSGLDSAAVAEQVRGVIIDALSAGEPEVAAVAAELAMSPRSLQRKLSEEGTTFRAVLADVRSDLADALLDAGTPVTETALRVGFSEAAVVLPGLPSLERHVAEPSPQLSVNERLMAGRQCSAGPERSLERSTPMPAMPTARPSRPVGRLGAVVAVLAVTAFIGACGFELVQHDDHHRGEVLIELIRLEPGRLHQEGERRLQGVQQ